MTNKTRIITKFDVKQTKEMNDVSWNAQRTAETLLAVSTS